MKLRAGACAPALAVSLVFRFIWLDRLPGINGDEAWYGVQIEQFLRGETSSWRTPSGLPVHPLLFLTEAALLTGANPSFWVLRLPIALWACVGLVLTYRLHQWVFRDRDEAVLATTLTACLPAHLAYSRFCWDASFGFVSLPLVIYPLLKMMEWQRTIHLGTSRVEVRTLVMSATLFVAGVALTLLAHVTNGVLLLASVLLVVCEFWREGWRLIRKLPITSAGLCLIGLAAILRYSFRHPSRVTAHLEMVATSLIRLPQHLVSLGDLLFGPRVYEYLAGISRPSWAAWVYLAALVVGLGGGCLLFRRGSESDRRSVVLLGFTVAILLAVGAPLRLDEPGYERYLLHLIPLGVLAFVRGLRVMSRVSPSPPPRSPAGARDSAIAGSAECETTVNVLAIGVVLVVSLAFLGQFWAEYFVPLLRQSHRANLHRTFQTGPAEPKAAAAEAIRRLSDGREACAVFAEDWWVQHPVAYLLRGRLAVERGPVRLGEAATIFVIGFSEGRYVADAAAAARLAGRRVEDQHFDDSQGRPILTLLIID